MRADGRFDHARKHLDDVMIGIVIVTHGRLGDSLVEAAEFILGARLSGVESVSININENVDRLRENVAEAVRKADQKEGVLILTDMFGGTPSNLSYSFLEEAKVEVISGVNLPMVIKAVNARNGVTLSELSEILEIYGKKSITVAGGLLKGNKRS